MVGNLFEFVSKFQYEILFVLLFWAIYHLVIFLPFKRKLLRISGTKYWGTDFDFLNEQYEKMSKSDLLIVESKLRILEAERHYNTIGMFSIYIGVLITIVVGVGTATAALTDEVKRLLQTLDVLVSVLLIGFGVFMVIQRYHDLIHQHLQSHLIVINHVIKTKS